MKRIILLTISLIAVLFVGAQNTSNVIHSIKGRVLDQVTNEPVAFTNISISDTFFGTASDESGDFELKIPGEMVSSEVHFSAVGYKKGIFEAVKLVERDYTIIKLVPQSYEIDNIDVEARSKVLMTILRMASENTPYNFIGGPFNLIAEYTNKKTIDDTISISRSADIVIFDKTGYKQPSVLNEFTMRKYEIKKDEPDYSFSSGITNFDEILRLDWVRSSSSVLNPALGSSFDLVLEDEPVLNGKPAWIISFSQVKPTLAGTGDFHATSFNGRITILKEDYSVTKIEGSAESVKHNRQGKFLAVGVTNDNYYSDVTYNFMVTYANLIPDELVINKKYNYQGRKIEENASLKIKQAQLTEIDEVTERDYFVE